jgi:hypothetical protein
MPEMTHGPLWLPAPNHGLHPVPEATASLLFAAVLPIAWLANVASRTFAETFGWYVHQAINPGLQVRRGVSA